MPTMSQPASACSMFGIICFSSLRSLAKKTKASKIIKAANISRQYNLGEMADTFLYNDLKSRFFIAKITQRESLYVLQ